MNEPPIDEAATDARDAVEPAMEMIDLFPGNGQAILGSAAPTLTEAIGRQAARQLVADSLPSAEEQEFGEQLAAACFGKTAALTSCGDMAVEWAIAAARVRGGGQKYKIITFAGDQHGQTLAGRAAAGIPTQQQDLGPMIAGFVHCPAGDATAVSQAIDDQTIAILVEPLQTSDGLRALPDGFLGELRHLADEHQLLLMVDESQLPIGLSGHVSYSFADDVVPDVLILAAGLAAGLPLGAVLLSQDLAAELANHPVLQTDPISPVVAAAALATLQTIETESLLQQVQAHAETVTPGLTRLTEDFEFVRAIRGRGLLLALEMDLEAVAVQEQLHAQGIRVGIGGSHTLRLQPPMTISADQLQRSLEILKLVFQSMEREPVIS